MARISREPAEFVCRTNIAQFTKTNGGWPTWKRYEALCKQRRWPIRRNAITACKRLDPISKHDAMTVCAWLRLIQDRRAFAWMRSFDDDALFRMVFRRADEPEEPLRALPGKFGRLIDMTFGAVAGRALRMEFSIMDPGVQLTSRREARQFFVDMVMTAGRSRAFERGAQLTSDDEIFEQERLDFPFKSQTIESMCEVVAEWWATEPLSLLYAAPDGIESRLGGMGTLPLTESEYSAIRDGKRPLHEIDTTQIQRQTEFLFIPLAPIIPNDNYADIEVEKEIDSCFMKQLIRFAPRLDGNPLSDFVTSRREIRILTFCGTPATKKTLAEKHFTALGRPLADTECELMEMTTRTHPELWKVLPFLLSGQNALLSTDIVFPFHVAEMLRDEPQVTASDSDRVSNMP